jgi:hypothetical protein
MMDNQGIKDLKALIQSMEPVLNEGEYVFSSVKNLNDIPREATLCEIKEKEGTTVILLRQEAERLGLTFTFVASWITLNVHSALDAIGLTAAFASALSKNNISCNVIAGHFHDHIFVDVKDGEQALYVLQQLTKSANVE